MNRPLLGTSLLAMVLAAVGFVVAYQFVKPAPPGTIRLATGSPDGAYHAFGEALKPRMKENGIELELIPSAGSGENAALLVAGSADVALMQGGTVLPEEPAVELRALGSLYFEALWIFHRLDAVPQQLADLAELRIARGAPGSGTRALVDDLLVLNGLDPGAMTAAEPDDPAAALQAGEIDVVMLVAGENSPRVRELLSAPGIELMDLPRAPAYPLHRRFLSALQLPAGAVDLARDWPAADRRLVGVAAMLVADAELHPALVDLLLMQAPEIVGGAGLFHDRGDFPSPEFVSLPLGAEAARFHRRGPSFLQSVLPFWAATLIDRMIVMVVPLLALVLPLARVFPPVYRWRVRSRIYRWYRDLKGIEARLATEGPGSELADAISGLEHEVRQVETPLSYADELYHLRSHIELVRRKVADGQPGNPEKRS
ncbi:MAG: TAXI family TRAP transporter solute-binding subunit [Pseudomonadota bacterium]